MLNQHPASSDGNVFNDSDSSTYRRSGDVSIPCVYDNRAFCSTHDLPTAFCRNHLLQCELGLQN